MVSFEQDPTDPTGIKDLTPRGSSEVATARNRKASAALAIRRAGGSWEDVAEVVGYPNANAALVAVENALKKELKTPETREFLRALAGQRLDRLLRGVWKKAIDEDHPEQLAAVGRARDLISDFRKLEGLDAPSEYVVSSPTQTELERWVADVTMHAAPALAEADIFDITTVEDGRMVAGEMQD